MFFGKVADGYLLRVERGEEVIASLMRFVEKFKIKGGSFVGLGACERLELGCFDAHNGQYIRKLLEGEYEVTNITGNIAYFENVPVIHTHITLSDSNMQAFGGHLFSGVVSGTLELHITVFGSMLTRAKDPVTGLNLWNLAKVE